MNGFIFDYGWRKKECKQFLGKTITFDIVIDSYTESDIITENQKDTYRKIDEIFETIMNNSLDRLESYCKTEYEVLYKREEIMENINLVDLIIFDSVGESRLIGLTIDCIWDEENGIGIKFKNEEIIEIGTQDIVI